jgi:hypothetical protein
MTIDEKIGTKAIERGEALAERVLRSLEASEGPLARLEFRSALDDELIGLCCSARSAREQRKHIADLETRGRKIEENAKKIEENEKRISATFDRMDELLTLTLEQRDGEARRADYWRARARRAEGRRGRA